jgi:predicted PurR-regulated permease PerM
MRAVALAMGLYVIGRLFWFANALFLTTFLGILFGLAVSAGVDRLAALRIPRGIGAALIVIAFLGALTGFGAWVAPTLRTQGAELRRRLPDAIDRFESWANSHRGGVVGTVLSAMAASDSANGKAAAPPPAPAAPVAAAVNDTLSARVRTTPSTESVTVKSPLPKAAPGAAAARNDSVSVTTVLRHRLTEQFSGVTRWLFPFLSSTLQVVGGILIIIFLSIYIAADPSLYHAGIMHLFPRRRRRRAGEVLSAIAAVLRRWLITQLIAMCVIGTVSTVVLMILDVRAAFALGVLSGLFEFIPTVGPIISAVPAVAMGFLDSPEKALLVAGAYVLVQFMENHLLIPLLMKGGIDVPPALTILSQALLAMLFGFLGLMCAVPLLAATMVAVKLLYVENVVGDRPFAPDENPRRGVA